MLTVEYVLFFSFDANPDNQTGIDQKAILHIPIPTHRIGGKKQRRLIPKSRLRSYKEITRLIRRLINRARSPEPGPPASEGGNLQVKRIRELHSFGT